MRPTSAHPLARSQSHNAIKWTPGRPLTDLTYQAHNENQSNKELIAELSLDSPHAKLPKESLGSRLSNTVTRPQTAILKARPTFKINTLVMPKSSTSQYIDNKKERIDLIKKLQKLCNTRSLKLFEDNIKDEYIPKIEYQNTLAIEVKRIWDKNDQLSYQNKFSDSTKSEDMKNQIRKIRPLSAAKNCKSFHHINHIFIPGLDKINSDSLPIIPESRDKGMDSLGIESSELKFFKKPCDIKVFNFNMKEKPPISGFKGKLVKKKRRRITISFKKPTE
ncbi:hypothetical protein SteCoe_3829 [Stentor coeruleus]|uniref:Uncharacterized protein n=1 Tax=Stentor coeruleus TaxID=5963 RepID=A0A1R2CW64_9CILI|nr:hypothetical protein SteCoe_3829 [Stentor coeruleus]